MPNMFRSGQQVELGEDSRCQLVKRIYPVLVSECLLHQTLSAIGYRSAMDDNTSYVTAQSPFAHKAGLVKIVASDGNLVAVGADLPHPLARTFHMMYDVLPGAVSAFTLGGNLDAPRTWAIFEPGTEEHAVEICATMEEIEKDIFCAVDGELIHMAVCCDADYEGLERLINRCVEGRELLVENLDRAHIV